MAAKYRKIDPRIWGDEKFELLTTVEKLVAFNCLTAQSNRIGVFKFYPGLGAEQCRMPADSYAIAIGRVCAALKWGFDKERNVLFIPSWFKYNPPENPKHFAGCLSDLHDLPQTPLVKVFLANVTHVPHHCLKVLGEARDSYMDSYAKAMAYQEQEQEQEQENTPIAPKGAERVAEKQSDPQAAAAAEMRTDAAPATPEGFAKFWAAWPRHDRKVGKAQALRIWKRQRLEPIAEQVIAALGRCKVSAGWTKKGGEFIPQPATWLNKTPWLTDPDDLAGGAPKPDPDADPDGFVPVRPSHEYLDSIFPNPKANP